MKQYTTTEQTAKLIELGFDKPKSIIDAWAHETDIDIEYVYEYAYSIGELIDMLPESASLRVRYVATKRAWIVDVDVLGKQGRCHRGVYYKELIDALYAMIISLNKECVL